MVMPRFETTRLKTEGCEVFYDVVGWGETEDPSKLLRRAMGGHNGLGITVGIAEQRWGMFVLGIQSVLPKARYVNASRVLAPQRILKDKQEILNMLEIGRRMDFGFSETCKLKFAGRTELEVARDIFEINRSAGLNPIRVSGAASGPNSALPHHRSGDRQVKHGQEEAFLAIRPGVECQAIERAGRNVIAQAGYGEYFTHRLGHGIGLDVQEQP